MANNSSSFNNLQLFSNVSFPFLCSTSPISISIFTYFTVVSLLLLPLFVSILVLGFRRWKQHCAASHSDHFTYHMAVMECITTCGCVMYTVAAYYRMDVLVKHSLVLVALAWSAKVYFNALICVECYLAVVHPITYLGLKKRGGVQIRNISIGCVWLLCFLSAGASSFSDDADYALLITSEVVTLIVVSFCSFSVLCVLIRPGPAKEKVDQSKKRAFQTLVLILAVLLFGTLGLILCDFVSLAERISEIDRCAAMTSALWFSLPGSLVLPLLFLHRMKNGQR